MGTEEAPETEYEPGEIYEDARGFRYLRMPAGSPLSWLLIHRAGDAIGRLEDVPERPLRKMVPEGAAETKLAEARTYCQRRWVERDGFSWVRAYDLLAIIGSEEGDDHA
jgi:hypothetical protein